MERAQQWLRAKRKAIGVSFFVDEELSVTTARVLQVLRRDARISADHAPRVILDSLRLAGKDATPLAQFLGETRQETETILSGAIESGLPTREDIDHRRILIQMPLIVRGTEDRGLQTEKDQCFAGGHPENFSPDQYAQFVREFAQNAEELAVRFERQKIRLLSSWMRGSCPEPKDLDYEAGKLTPVGQLTSIASKLSWDEPAELSTSQRQSLLEKANVLIPEVYRLKGSTFLSGHDADRLNDLSSAMRFEKPLPEDLQHATQKQLEEICALERKLADMRTQRKLFANDGGEGMHERTMRELWAEYRRLLKAVAALEESPAWYSPTYGASLRGQKGPGQRSEPCRTDYQRWKMDDVVELERELTKMVFPDTKRIDAESVLSNSGMAALSGIFAYIDREIAHAELHKLKPPVMKTEDQYFEVDQAIDDHFSSRGMKPREFDPQDIDALAQAMGKEVPVAVFLNPQSNMYEMKPTDISHLLEKLTDRAWFDSLPKKFKNNGYWTHHIHLIIDNSTLGRLAKWKEFNFALLPQCIRIITFESLIKFAQDGQDIAQGGLATALGSYAGSDLRRFRSQLGLMPPETTVRRLQSFGSADTQDRKLERHSRNTLFLANEIQSSIEEGGFLKEVVHPLLPSHPQHAIAKRENAGAGGLFHIGLNVDFLRNYCEVHRYSNDRLWFQENAVEPSKFKEYAESIARAYLHLVVALAKRGGVELNLGTSYGFHTTRLAVYTKLRTKQEESDRYFTLVPYLRVATGTENIKDCTLIADVIKRADAIFTHAIDHGEILMLSRLLLRNGEKALDWNFGL